MVAEVDFWLEIVSFLTSRLGLRHAVLSVDNKRDIVKQCLWSFFGKQAPGHMVSFWCFFLVTLRKPSFVTTYKNYVPYLFGELLAQLVSYASLEVRGQRPAQFFLCLQRIYRWTDCSRAFVESREKNNIVESCVFLASRAPTE